VNNWENSDTTRTRGEASITKDKKKEKKEEHTFPEKQRDVEFFNLTGSTGKKGGDEGGFKTKGKKVSAEKKVKKTKKNNLWGIIGSGLDIHPEGGGPKEKKNGTAKGGTVPKLCTKSQNKTS